MKKILMISFCYPPYNSGSGWLRVYNFCKYLPFHGWQPFVLTAKEKVYEFLNPIDTYMDLEKFVKRTQCFDIKKIFFRGKYPSFLAIPDRYWSWIPFGIIQGLKILKKENINVIYSTYRIPSAHLIAYSLKRIKNVKWIADFRDPWLEEDVEYQSIMLKKSCIFFEKIVIDNADMILLTTKFLKKYYMDKYPQVSSQKFKVVYNGYEEAYFSKKKKQNIRHFEGTLEIAHAGMIDKNFRNPEPLFTAVRELINEEKITKNSIKITLIGADAYTKSKEFFEIVDNYKLDNIIHVMGKIPYDECIDYLYDVDVLLLLQYTKEVRMLIPAKAFEYLRIGNPILTIADQGETTDLMTSCKAGWTVNPKDIPAIKKALLKALELKKLGQLSMNNKASIENFSREVQTERFSNFINYLIE